MAPLLAVALEFKAAYDRIEKEAERAQRRALKQAAAAVLREARSSIKKSAAASAPGHPFKSKTGATKKLLGSRVGKRTAFVGYRQGKVISTTNKKGRTARAVPNILEHGAGHMAARPVLEPALERAKEKAHPFRGIAL